MPSRAAPTSTLNPPPAAATAWRASRSPPRSGSRSTYSSTSTTTLPTRTSLRGRTLTPVMLAGTLPEASPAAYFTLRAPGERLSPATHQVLAGTGRLSGVLLRRPAVLKEHLPVSQGPVEEHQAILPAVARVPLQCVLREAPADLDPSGVCRGAEVRFRWAGHAPRVIRECVEPVERASVPVQPHRAVVVVERRGEEHPLALWQDGLPVLACGKRLGTAGVDAPSEGDHS